MDGALGLVLWSLVIFQAKHSLVDFVLAPAYGLRGGPGYLDTGRLLHGMLHAAGSLPAVLLLTGSGTVIAGILLAEWVLTYQLAWGRDRGTLSPRLGTLVRPEAVIGTEQLLHQLFYIGAIALLT
jgi:hypothetical protein